MLGVRAAQVAAQQGRVNVLGGHARFPQGLHFIELDVTAVARGDLVHAEHMFRGGHAFQQILRKLAVPNRAARCDEAHPRGAVLRLLQGVKQVELDVQADQHFRANKRRPVRLDQLNEPVRRAGVLAVVFPHDRPAEALVTLHDHEVIAVKRVSLALEAGADRSL
ncbi:hypothetical protein BABAYKA_00030 [Brevundimonas phage vB_BpoS-Babayka]|uniref:Uncharacterized protein n=1 Tax=Brevundimonas phage vB_BpoS-Babayka TaxID=2948596 RepID=A0A9E7MVS3_9CAUD|nr:hypothetical protein BABAYKA_00030 [Brevundimonas phage vB_BpoS-Babayka]